MGVTIKWTIQEPEVPSIQNAVITYNDMQVKGILTWPRIEPGTFCTDSRRFTTELLRNVISLGI